MTDAQKPAALATGTGDGETPAATANGDSTGSVPAGAEQQGETATGATPAGLDRKAVFAFLDTLSVDELLSHNKIAGLAGHLADRAIRSARDEDLMEKDPGAYVQTVKQRKADAALQAQLAAREAEVSQEAWAKLDKEVLIGFHAGLPEGLRDTLGAKTYEGTSAESRRAYLTEAFQAAVDFGKSQATQRTHDEAPAAAKLGNTATRAGAKTPDLSGVAAPPAAALTREQLSKMTAEQMVDAGVFNNTNELAAILAR